MNGRAWTTDDDENMRINYPDFPTFLVAYVLDRPVSSVYGRAHLLGLRKSQKYLDSKWACRLRRGEHVGKGTQFKKGQVPHNKGLRRPGWAPGRMRETQFKKGERHGRAAQVYQPIGSERISKDGYLQRKINNDMPFQQRWRGVHILLWEEHLGPLPPGFAVCFKNGDKTGIRIDNLALVSRSELMRRNSYHNRYPKEIARLIQLRGALVRTINRRTRNEPRHQRPARGTVRDHQRTARQGRPDADRARQGSG